MRLSENKNNNKESNMEINACKPNQMGEEATKWNGKKDETKQDGKKSWEKQNKTKVKNWRQLKKRIRSKEMKSTARETNQWTGEWANERTRRLKKGCCEAEADFFWCRYYNRRRLVLLLLLLVLLAETGWVWDGSLLLLVGMGRALTDDNSNNMGMSCHLRANFD